MPPFRAEPPLIIKPSKLEGEPSVPGGKPNSVTNAPSLFIEQHVAYMWACFLVLVQYPESRKTNKKPKLAANRCLLIHPALVTLHSE